MSKDFHTPGWVRHTNVYEVNLRQYTSAGTLNAFKEELLRLKNMGVHTLWFMPVTPISQKHMKGALGSYYACSDYTAVSPEFGTLDDFRSLVKAAHDLEMKVILDWVANHTGWDHVWTTEHPEWYERDEKTGDFKTAWGMQDIIELEFKNPELREAMIEAMIFWVRECDIDGFRCDLATWVELDFWQEARPRVDAGKPLFWLGEFDELENPDYMTVFDACYSWFWMHKSKDFYELRFPLSELEQLLQRYLEAARNGSMQIWFTTNHDENTWNGTEFEKYGPMAGLLAVFSATWYGIPLVYSGQEIPNTKRLAFFDKDPIEWKEECRLEGFYRELLSLHTRYPALASGDTDTIPVRIPTNADDRVLCFLRKKAGAEVLVFLNFSDQHDIRVHTEDTAVHGKFHDIFSGTDKDFSADNSILIAAWGYHVFVK